MTALVERLTELPLRRPPLTVAVAIAALVVSGVAISRLEFVSDLAEMLPTPAAKTLNRVAEQFGTGERATILLEASVDGRAADLQRVGEQLRERLVGTAGIASVSWGPSVRPDAVLERLLLPYGVLYLPPESLEQRFSRAGVEAQLEQQASRLGLLGLGQADVWAERDPLDLHRGLAASAKTLGGGLETDAESGVFLSTDRRALLVLVESESGTSTLGGARAVVKAIRDALAATLAEPWARGLTARSTGGQFLSEESERIIRRDLVRSFGASIGLAIVLLAVCLRLRLTATLLLCLPTLWGTGVGAGLFALLRPSLAVLSLGCSAVLIGLGIDFTVHLACAALAARAEGTPPREAILKALVETRGALTLAAFSSMAAFLAFLAADQQILRDMGLLTACGLLACLLGALGVLPVLLLVIGAPDGRSAPRDLGVRAAGRFAGRKPWVVLGLTAALTACAGAGVAYAPPGFETNLRRLHASGSEPLATQDRIEERFGGSQESLVVLLEASDVQGVVDAAHRLEPTLSKLVGEGALASRSSIAALLPSAAQQASCLERLSALDASEVGRDLRAGFDAIGFDPAVFEDYIAGVEEAVALRAPLTVEGLEALGLGTITRQFVRHDATGASSVVLLTPKAGLWAADEREAVVTSVRGVLASLTDARGTISGLPILSSEASALVESAFSRVAGVTIALVLTGLFLRFRSPVTVALVLLPAALGTLWTAGAFSLLDLKLNLMNLGVLPMVLAIGVDDGIHLIHRVRQGGEGPLDERLSSTATAIALTSLTTMITFGSLAVSENQGIASVGALSFVGVGSCLLATVVVLPAILSLSAPKEDT